MTIPLLPFGNLMTWGSPWHGLVKDSLLTLPSGATMDYSQPGSGDTYLVKFNGVPEVERSIAQQAADNAADYDWRNYAIIAGSGFQLHGKSIGSPWLHKDSSGKVWRVSVTFSSGTNVTVTFTEFGRIRLGDEPGTEFQQTLSLTGTSVAEIDSITVMDVRPDGDEALFIVKGGSQSSIVKFSVAALVCQVVILKTNDEMMVDHSIDQVIDTVEDETYHTPSYYRVQFAGPSSEDLGYIEFSSSPLSDIYDEAGETVGNAESFGALFYIVGSELKEKTESIQYFLWACYDASGGVHYYSSLYKNHDRINTVKDGDYSGSYSSSATGGSALSTSGAVTLNSGTTVTNNQTYTYQLLRDDEVMDEYVVSLEQTTYTGTVRVFTGASNVVEIYDDNFDILPGGSAGSTTPVSTDEKSALFNGNPLEASLDIEYQTTYYLSSSPKTYEPLSDDLPGFEIIQSTNKLIHAVVEYNYLPGYRVGRHIAPDTADAIESEVSHLDNLYASYQPETKQIVREKDSNIAFV